MIGIKIGGEFLDLQNVVLDSQEENPYLQFMEGMKGPFTFPFNLQATDKNMKLLQYAPVLPVRRSKLNIPAVLFEHGITHSRGSLKIDGFDGNLNRVHETTTSWYYTYGVSSFYDLVKDKRLNELDYGIESHTWTGFSYTDAGFFAHIHRVFHQQPGSYKYAMFPVKNTDDIDPVRSEYWSYYNFPFEKISAPFDTVIFSESVGRIVPFPYLKNILQTIFTSVGWTLEGAVLSDPNFLKICLLNSYLLSWWPSRWNPAIPVEIDLANHVPNVAISSFLIGLKNRFGWWYDFDPIKKKCTIHYIGDIFTNRKRKDFTASTGATYSSRTEKQNKIYALQGSLEDSPPDLSQVKYQGTTARRLNLPVANAARLDHCYFVANENAFYYCVGDDTGSSYSWEYLSSNVTAFIPDGATETITTNCNIPHLVESVVYRAIIPVQGTDFRMIIQEISLPPDNARTDDFYITYHHGPKNVYWKDGSASAVKYSHASPHNYDAEGNRLQNAVLNWQFVDHVTGQDIGIYTGSWAMLLNALVQNEIATFRLYLPFADMLNLNWIDSVIIKNTEWMIKTKKRLIPYPGFIDCELIRL
jgi:hypothetical protein